jgi:SAM-dependent MidA family methyltransferase
MSLTQTLRTYLQQHGPMSFASFMQRALYTPSLGYYNARVAPLGKAGDFVTAPELTPLFGQSLANAVHTVLATFPHPILFEFGAGSGQLCIDLLRALAAQQCLPDSYYIFEISPALQSLQQERIAALLPADIAARVQWLESWPTMPFCGVVLANEVLDAMPVHRFMKAPEGLLESHVTLNAQDEIIEIWQLCTHEGLIEYVQRSLAFLPLGYQSEVNLNIPHWISQCSTMLSAGLCLFIDYGFPRHEYYHVDRSMGTLMCHYQHTAHPNPLLHIGQQDITAHVDFTHVAEAAVESGFHVAGFTSQAAYLLGNRLLERLPIDLTLKAQHQMNTAIKTLTHPSEMGELFKVIALTKAITVSLPGFQFDRRAIL